MVRVGPLFVHLLDAVGCDGSEVFLLMVGQNYFVFQNTSYSQTSGLAMGAPSSAILSEVFLQYLEHTKIADILVQHNIIGYFRYVDDILVIYDTNLTDINEIQTIFNTLTPTLKFTLEKESEHRINFLDLTIHNTESMFSFSIYRKPTSTDIIIPAESNHPPEHKHAYLRRLKTKTVRQNGWNTDNACSRPVKKLQLLTFHMHSTKTSGQQHQFFFSEFTYLLREILQHSLNI